MMHVERLRRLVEVLREVERLQKPFDMSEWVAAADSAPDDAAPKISCGTASCALGWHARHPDAIADGLHIERRGGDYFPVFADEMGVDAAVAYYDISPRNAEMLFMPHTYNDYPDVPPRMVIDRIEAMLATETSA